MDRRQALHHHEYETTSEDKLATFLGCFSIGLGIAEIAAAGGVARLIGANDDDRTRMMLRAFGFREIASGTGILMRPDPAGWLWSRVAGDMMDLAFLGSAMRSERADRTRLMSAAAAVAGVAALDVLCSRQFSRDGGATRSEDRGIHVRKTISINRSPEEVYRFWRDFQNLPRFMDHLESVQVYDDRRSHWKAKAPAGTTVEWDAEITSDEPNSYIAWRSLEGADVDNFGSVRFAGATGGRGSEVHVELHYDPPGGAAGAAFAKLFGEEPGQQVQEDLRRFKQVMETGEAVLSDATLPGARAAQPLARQYRSQLQESR